MGNLSTPAAYQVDISAAFPQVASKLTTYLTANPIFIGFVPAFGSLFNVPIHVNVGNIDLSTFTPVGLTLTDLPLGAAQNVVSNCYGSYTFC